jgi:hypothetical protein
MYFNIKNTLKCSKTKQEQLLFFLKKILIDF